MEEQRTFYLRQVDSDRTTDNVTEIINSTLTNLTDTPTVTVSEPWLSTETCAYIQGGILATLFIIAMTR